MKAVYFDCFAGASGDMIVGALVDLGLDFDLLKQDIGSLGLEDYDLTATRVVRCGIAATKFHVAPPRRASMASMPETFISMRSAPSIQLSISLAR
jgi:uncharacterized protein (DUF111 family)